MIKSNGFICVGGISYEIFENDFFKYIAAEIGGSDHEHIKSLIQTEASQTSEGP